MIHDCGEFKDLLVDLVYDEVEDSVASRLREHAASCIECRGELESILLTRKLASTLPEPQLDEDWGLSILELADDAAARFASNSEDRDRVSDASFDSVVGILDRKPGFFESLRTVLLRPAIVTAAAASVVFVVSFFLFQNAGHQPTSIEGEISGAPFTGPAYLDEVAQSTSSPDMTVPNRPRRIPETPDREETAKLAALESAARMATGGGGRQSSGSRIGTAGPTPKNPADKFALDDSILAKKSKSAPFAPAPTMPAALAEDLDTPAGAAAGKSAVGTGYGNNEAPGMSGMAAQAPSAGGEALFRDGMDAFNRGDCSSATSALQKVVDPPLDAPGRIPAALHHLGRCAKRTGQCGKALLNYENLLDRYPGYAGRFEAMWEAVACHRRLGHVGRATEILEELAKNPAWSARAKAELRDLGALDK